MGEQYEDGEWVALSAEATTEESDGWRDEAALQLRPRTSPQVLDLGLEVLGRRFLACVGICVMLWLPVRVMMPFFTDFLQEYSSRFETDWMMFGVGMLIMMAAQSLVDVLATTVVTLIAYADLVGSNLSPFTALRRTLGRLIALIFVFLVKFIILSVGGGLVGVVSLFCPPLLIVALVYFVFFGWKLSVAPSALILEELSVGQALRRSFELTEGSMLRWVGVTVLAWILVSGMEAGLQLGDNVELRDWLLSSSSIPSAVFTPFFVMISAVIAGLASAVTTVSVTAYYLDTRIRREGLDLFMRLERLKLVRGGGAASP